MLHFLVKKTLHACKKHIRVRFASFARNMSIKPDLNETAISTNKQMEDLNSAKLFVKERLAKDHYIKESEI